MYDESDYDSYGDYCSSNFEDDYETPKAPPEPQTTKEDGFIFDTNCSKEFEWNVSLDHSVKLLGTSDNKLFTLISGNKKILLDYNITISICKTLYIAVAKDHTLDSYQTEIEYHILQWLETLFKEPRATINFSNYRKIERMAKELGITPLAKFAEDFSLKFEPVKNVELLIEIQATLFALDENNTEKIAKYLAKSYLSNDVIQLIFLIRSYYYTRPKNWRLVMNLIIYLTHESTDDNKLADLPNELLKYLFSHLSRTTYQFAYRLYSCKIISLDQLIFHIKQLETIECICWYAPLIEEGDPEYFSKLLFITPPDRRVLFRNFNGQQESAIYNYCTNMDYYRADNWKLHRCALEIGHEPSPLIISLLEDDVLTFQELVSAPGFDLNTIVRVSIFESQRALQGPNNLITYAAYFGSVQCFKYLLLNGAQISDEEKSISISPFCAAIIADVPEIIHLCQNHTKHTVKAFLTCIEYFRPEILQWIKDTFPKLTDISIPLSQQCIAAYQFSNYKESIDLLPRTKRSLKNNDLLGQYFASVENDDPALAKMLIMYQRDSFRKEDYAYTELMRQCGTNNNYYTLKIFMDNFMDKMKYSIGQTISQASEKGSLEVVKICVEMLANEERKIHLISAIPHAEVNTLKYIMSLNIIDVNEVINGDPLLRQLSIQSCNYQCIQYVLSLPNIDVNKSNSSGGNMLTGITWGCNIEATKLLLTRDDVNVNVVGTVGETPLTGSIIKKSKQLLELLLNYKTIDVNMPNKKGQSPLYVAFKTNDIEIVKMLMDKGAKFDWLEKDNPICMAISTPLEELIPTLLEIPEIDINSKDPSGFTPFVKACSCSNAALALTLLQHPKFVFNDSDNYSLIAAAVDLLSVELIEMLLQKGATSINGIGYNGHTPLTSAISKSDMQVFEFLLSLDGIDVNMKNSNGVSPLLQATMESNPLIVERLLQFPNIDVNSQDMFGLFPLRAAAGENRIEIVEALLNYHDININLKTYQNGTALSAAISINNIDIARMLIEHGAGFINQTGQRGETLLTDSIISDHFEAFEFLLSQPNIDINKPNRNGKTPLKVALALHHRYIDMLLERDDLIISINTNEIELVSETPTGTAEALFGNQRFINSIDLTGSKILFDSIKYDLDGLAGILINSHKIDLNMNIDRETPMSLAIAKNAENLVKLLIENGANPCINTKYGETSLTAVITYGNFNLFSLLLDLPAIDPNQLDSAGIAPIHFLARSNLFLWLPRFFSRPDIDVNIHSTNECFDGVETALHIAVRRKNLQFIKELCKHPDIDVNALNNEGSTPLRIACGTGSYETVLLLLSQKQIDINLANKFGGNPFTAAVHENNIGIAKLLIQHGFTNINKEGSKKETPLSNACRQGYANMVEFLLSLPDIDVNQAQDDADPPFFAALNSSHYDIALMIFKHPKFNRKLKDNEGNTCLIAAVRADRYDLIQEFVSPETINEINNNGMSALFESVTIARHLIFSFLIDLNADYNLILQNGNNIIHFAILNNNDFAAIRCLSLPAIDINWVNNEGYSPFWLAVQCNEKVIINELLRHPELDINAGIGSLQHIRPSFDICTAIVESGKLESWQIPNYMLAYYIENDASFETAVKLVKKGANGFNSKSPNGATPLTAAIQKNQFEIFDYLLSIDETNVNQRDKLGCTPLLVAVVMNKRDFIVELIKSHNLDPNIADFTGTTPLRIASMESRLGLVMLLLQIPGIDVNKRSFITGDTALTAAVLAKSLRIVKLLVEKGANVNEIGTNGKHNLLISLQNEDFAMFQYLCSIDGIDFNCSYIKRTLLEDMIKMTADEYILEVLKYPGVDVTPVKEGKKDYLDLLKSNYNPHHKVYLAMKKYIEEASQS